MPSLALASSRPALPARAIACASWAVIAAASAPAHAERDPERKWRAEAGVGGLIGAVRVGENSMFGSGLHVDLGARRGRIQFLGSYTFLNASESAAATAAGEMPEPRGGHVHRLGGAARGSLGRWGSGPVRGDLWIEGGAGRQALRMDGIGSRTRGDLALGFGGQFSARLGKRFRLGVYYAFRGMFAAGDRDEDAPPVCAAPCDTATRPFPVDRSFLFDIGFVVGN